MAFQNIESKLTIYDGVSNDTVVITRETRSAYLISVVSLGEAGLLGHEPATEGETDSE